MASGALDYLHAAAHWFGRHPDQLGPSERKVLRRKAQWMSQATREGRRRLRFPRWQS